jgi:glyoxylase-like metal-dependent hydrolase (beta-lactamase superfamily II)
MLKIHTLTLGAYQTNCYIIHADASKTCCVIDPGYEGETILAETERLGLEVEAVLLTHGHFDHVGAVKQLAVETGCAVYLNEKDLALPRMMTAGVLYYTHTYAEGDVLSLSGLQIRVLETPGHTPGSVCLETEDALFTGDTLFAGSCGRVDFPGSSPKAMRQSLARLNGLERDYAVYPGHGGATTLSGEKKYNPYLKGFL